MRKLANGDLVAPKRGDPPDPPPGYVRDPRNAFLFHLDLEDCKHRDVQTYIKPCGKIGVNLYCRHFCKLVNNLICDSCPIPEEGE